VSIRISDLLLSPKIPSSTRLVAGSTEARIRAVRGEDGTVETVSWRLSGEAQASRPGERARRGLALVLLTPVVRFDARFDVLLRRCALAGVVAVALVPADPLLRLGPGVDELASRLGIALLEVADPWEFSLQLHIMIGDGAISAARAALDVAAVGLGAGPPIENTFAALESVLGYPLEFLVAAARPLRGALELSERQRRALSSAAAGTDEPARVAIDQGELIALPVGTGIGPMVWVGVVRRSGARSERATIVAALRVASIIVSHALILTRLVDERDARNRTSMLEELRGAASSTPSPSFVQRTIAAGWRLDEWHIGIRLVARNADDFVTLRRDVEVAFANAGLEVDVIEQVDGWALWSSMSTEPGPAHVRDIALKIRQAQIALQPTVDTNLGVGSVQAGAAGLARTLGEAADAARVAAGRPESGHFVHVDRLGLAQLLLAWTQTDTFLPAAHQLLAPLSRSAGDLLRTLDVYLDAESSLAETGATLGVHRNTVADRIGRIERLLGVDLHDAETRLALHLAVRTINR
jgi:hypothetical protein